MGINTDITALYGMPSTRQAPPPTAQPQAAAPRTAGEELTTVTTNCDKKHWHTQSCPHTVSTRPADPQRGNFIDTYA